jgi:hypothetical protein
VLALLPAAAAAQETEAQQLVVKDDWLVADDAHFKVYLPGEWACEVTRSDVGVEMTAHSGNGKLLLTIQTIEGKQEATPEKLQKDIFEQHHAAGAARQDEPSERGLRARYEATIAGQPAVLKALFASQPGKAVADNVSYMVYMQALAEDVKADPELEKMMDSILKSFEPV